jgi:hypothetical protein
MSLQQIDRLFFSGEGRTQSRARLRALFANGYVNMPGVSTIHKVPHQETIYWLDKRGAEVVAALYGEPYKGFPWRRRPRWSTISHDLLVNDFRIDVMEACDKASWLRLHRWVPESDFLADRDKVIFRDRKGVKWEREVRPDGFFLIRQYPGKQKDFAFLLEVDMGSHSNVRFIRHKVLAGIAYLKDKAYRKRLGVHYGRWLVVTRGEQRMKNLKHVTEKAGGQGLFYFTTFDSVSVPTVLSEPIWLLAGEDELTGIIPGARFTSP